MSHSHAHHAHAHHAHAAGADRRRLASALGLILVFLTVEVVAGLLSHSLALLSDAAHMLTDAGALALSLLAAQLAARPAAGRMTFGLGRSEILSAQFNGATLLVLGVLIVYGAVQRLISPPAVTGAVVVAIAAVGIAVNLLAARILSGSERRSLNVEGALQHILTDLAAFIFTVLAGVVILTTGFRRADGIASLLVAGIMLRSAYCLLKASGRVFLEAAPEGVDPDAIGRRMAAETGVIEIHDLHVWEVTSGFPAMSAHVVVAPDADCHEVSRRLRLLLHQQFELDHTTLQVDHMPVELLEIEVEPGPGGALDRPQ